MSDSEKVRSPSCSSKNERACPAHVSAMELPAFKRSLERSGMSEQSFVTLLTQTALAPLVTWTGSDLEHLLITCERHGLNPVGREVFMLRPGDPLANESLATPALVVLGVDGWSRILNSHKAFAGMQFKESAQLIDGVPAWAECTLHRWDRRVPTRVREYLIEVRGAGQAWLTHPRRMLRHKALVQCARLAFGLVGVYDSDEAERIASQVNKSLVHKENSRTARRSPSSSVVGLQGLKEFLEGAVEAKG